MAKKSDLKRMCKRNKLVITLTIVFIFLYLIPQSDISRHSLAVLVHHPEESERSQSVLHCHEDNVTRYEFGGVVEVEGVGSGGVAASEDPHEHWEGLNI